MNLLPNSSRFNAELTMQPVVLIVNSDFAAQSWIEATVTASGLRALSFDSTSELISHVTANTAACVILDVSLPDGSCFDLQEQLFRLGASVLYVTRERCIASCVRAIKAGAVDFLTMPCDATVLVRALEYAVRQARCLGAQRERLSELRFRYEQLTRREREVLVLVSSGMLNKQIAQTLDISDVTVQVHRSRVMKKMCARSFAALVRMADALQAASSCCGH